MADTPQRRGLLAQLQRPVTAPAGPTVGHADVLAWSATLVLATSNPTNGSHGHWSGKAKRAKAQRTAVRDLLRRSALSLPPLPVVITLVRVAPGKPMDQGNLGATLKPVQDGVADVYGVDDGVGERDGRYTWAYEQRSGRPLAVEVRVERAQAAAPTGRRGTRGIRDGSTGRPAAGDAAEGHGTSTMDAQHGGRGLDAR